MKKANALRGWGRELSRFILVGIGFCPLLPGSVLAGESSEVSQKIALKSGVFSALPASAHGGLIGRAKNTLLAAAAPNAPRADGALSIWTCPLRSDQESGKSWKESAVTIPAWAASAKWDDRMIVVGGLLGGKTVSSISVLGVDESGGLKSERLPDLPRPLAGAGAAMIGTTLYVFGGVSSVEPAVFDKTLWKLDITGGVPAGSWREGEVFPDSPRAFFGVTEQYGMLCVFGGIEPGLRLSSETWVYRPQPIEATSYIGWKRVSDLPKPSARSSAIALGQASVMLIGGIDGESIQSLPPSTGPATDGGLGYDILDRK